MLSNPTALLLLTWPILAAGASFLQNDKLQAPFIALAIACLGVLVLARLGAGRAPAGRPQIQTTLLVVACFLALIVQAIFRAPESIMQPTAKILVALRLLLFFGIVLFAFLDAPPTFQRKHFHALLLSLPLFMVVNFVLWPTMTPAMKANEAIILSQLNTTLQFIGLQLPRLKSLPALQGASTIALLAGTAILALVYLAESNRTWRVLYWAMIIPNSVMLVLTDTRQLIVATIICLGIYACSLQRAVLITRAALILAVVSAPFLILLQKLVDMSGVTDLVVRAGGGERFGALTGRDVIWTAAFKELGEPKVVHLIGYGQYGDLVAGVSSSYAWMFYGTEGVASYHNAFLQYVLDSGYFSALFYFAATWITIKAFARGGLGSSASRAVLAIIALTLVGGFSEAIGTMRQLEHFTFLIGLMALAVLVPVNQQSAPSRFSARP